jgi:hypothetical protein
MMSSQANWIHLRMVHPVVVRRDSRCECRQGEDIRGEVLLRVSGLQAKHSSGFSAVRGKSCALNATTIGNPAAPAAQIELENTLAAKMRHGYSVAQDTANVDRSSQEPRLKGILAWPVRATGPRFRRLTATPTYAMPAEL